MNIDKWDKKIHRMLSLWLNQLASTRLAHHNASFGFMKINRRLLVSAIIVSAIAGSGSFINFGTFGTNVQKVITVIVGFFAVANVILTAIISEMKLEQKGEQHRHIATEYTHISTLIQTNMLAAKKPDIDVFLKTILDKITALQRYSPTSTGDHSSLADIPKMILKKHVHKKDVDINDLDLINDSDEMLLKRSDSEKDKHEQVEELKEVKLDD